MALRCGLRLQNFCGNALNVTPVVQQYDQSLWCFQYNLNSSEFNGQWKNKYMNHSLHLFNQWFYCAFATRLLAKALCFRAVHPPCLSVRSCRQILLPRYLINGLSNLYETYREYSLALLMTCLDCGGQSRGHSGSQHAVEVAKVSMSTLGRWSPIFWL